MRPHPGSHTDHGDSGQARMTVMRRLLVLLIPLFTKLLYEEGAEVVVEAIIA